ncbi:hypothetical protein F4803DRAFT_207921 [Xylaria telfairii]|nr:hypothetical protein F4803DRAFT_207921 [Xylaria telfairii]
MPSTNSFQVRGRTVVVTGGSSGMGLAVARQLAAKGANVLVVARDKSKLLQALAYLEREATNPQTQRFYAVSADLTVPSEASRVVQEALAWNSNSPPDIVWCCAGCAHPTLFIDTPVSEFSKQMNNNYFTSLHMAHAVLKCWLQDSYKGEVTSSLAHPVHRDGQSASQPLPRHLIFTASFLAFYSFAGYSSYSPCKAAIRSLSDSLSQEMNLYAAAHPTEPKIRLHTIFPSGILGDSFKAENRIKSDLTKFLEKGEEPQTPDAIAEKSIKGLESGLELVTTDILARLVKGSMLGGSVRGGIIRGFGDCILAGLMAIIMIFVRADHDKKVRDWGYRFGASGMK